MPRWYTTAPWGERGWSGARPRTAIATIECGGQLFFPEEITEEVSRLEPYTTRLNVHRTLQSEDMVFTSQQGGAGMLRMEHQHKRTSADGFTAAVTLASIPMHSRAGRHWRPQAAALFQPLSRALPAGRAVPPSITAGFSGGSWSEPPRNWRRTATLGRSWRSRTRISRPFASLAV
jgi:hypothetical protein